MDDKRRRGRFFIEIVRVDQVIQIIHICPAVVLELSIQHHIDVTVTRQKKMPLAIDFLPAGHMVFGALLRFFCCGLDVVSQVILTALADFDDTFRAPLVEKPVEVGKLCSGHLHLWQR